MLVITKRDLADGMGVSVATVESWQRAGLQHARKGNRNVYRLKEIIEFLRERDGHENLDARQEQAKLHRANRQLREIQIEEASGRLLPAPYVEAMCAGIISAARAKLLSLPNKLAAVAYGCTTLTAIETEARELVYEALTELSNTDILEYAPEPNSEALQPDEIAV